MEYAGKWLKDYAPAIGLPAFLAAWGTFHILWAYQSKEPSTLSILGGIGDFLIAGYLGVYLAKGIHEERLSK